MARRKVSSNVDLDFAFFTELRRFYVAKRGIIRQHYRELSKRFLDYNDPENAKAFLRVPQFEALETYIFLKEFLDNQPVHEIFKAWADESGKFEGRPMLSLFEQKDQYDAYFKQLRKSARSYPNYIFALTMGTGKTILMATCIFYEFILANKFPKDLKYCHNALVFAPDKTVLQSLREIETFDMSKVVPTEYGNFLSSNIRFHFLDESGTTLDTMDASKFNIIVSNTQKIILKRKSKEDSSVTKLFKAGKEMYQRDEGNASSIYAEMYSEFGILDEPEDEGDLMTNQRFEKLRRLQQLGIYVDEAHHAFGKTLERDLVKITKTSLRTTIDELAASLKAKGSQVVACYNYTGTPYIDDKILPEVVYAYGLKEAIDKRYLKRVSIDGFANVKDKEFIAEVVRDFLEHTRGLEPEGMKPKLAFFAPTIDDLQQNLRPALEAALIAQGIPVDTILVNVGDDKLTKNDDIREFNRLDTPQSDKQFILLVNKGREGWNCRSLFGVALFRKPKSKVFVLQATMRCLRSIGEPSIQHTGRVYLSDENIKILEEELQQNFRVSIDEINAKPDKSRKVYKVRVIKTESVSLKRDQQLFNVREKEVEGEILLGLDSIDTTPYHAIRTHYEGLPTRDVRKTEVDASELREKREFTAITLVAEVARYLHKPCLEVEALLERTDAGIERILQAINAFNEVLYEHVIPKLFAVMFEVEAYKKSKDYTVNLVKPPPNGDYYEVSAAEELVVEMDKLDELAATKSFHLDTYCFDSNPEHRLFTSLLSEEEVQKLFFTGMLTHGQSDFYVQYIDPNSGMVRSYYPDFLLQRADGSYVIVEVKGDNMIDDPVVKAKQDFAEQMAVSSGMTYRIIKGTDAQQGRYRSLFGKSQLDSASQSLLFDR